MSDQDPEQEEQSRRPRVVDKRVSARTARETTPPVPGPRPGEPRAPEPPPAPPQDRASAPEDTSTTGEEPIWTPEQEAEAQRMVEQIAQVPAQEWVADSCVRLANVASVKLDRQQPAEAQIAIDALAAIVAAVGPGMGAAEAPLKQTVAQLQMAYAQAVIPQPPAGL